MYSKKLPLILFFIICLISSIFGAEVTHSERTFLFCLKPSVSPLVIGPSSEKAEVDNQLINIYLNENGAVRIEQWIDNANPMDHDGDIYMNRIYRVYLSEEKRPWLNQIKNGIVSISDVLSSEYEYIRKPHYVPNDSQYDNQCSPQALGAEKAWDFWFDEGLVPEGQQVLLASVDQAVEYTHVDLIATVWVNQGEISAGLFNILDTDNNDNVTGTEIMAYLEMEDVDYNGDGDINLRDVLNTDSPFSNGIDDDGNGYADDFFGWDPAGVSGGDDNDPYPNTNGDPSNWDHGTNVAGILGAATDNVLGMASISYNCRVISVKCTRDNSSTGNINDGYSGIYYAARAGYYSDTFTIINNSWGGGGYSSYEQSQVNTAHNTYNAIVLSSSGNGLDSGGDLYAPAYPASYSNVVSVTALSCSGNWGYWATYHETVDFSAPGEGIYTLDLNNGYESGIMGTSFSCPNTASSFGLLRIWYPDLDNDELEELMCETADAEIYDINSDPDLQGRLGCGMVDIHRAIGGSFSPNIGYVAHTLIPLEGDGDGNINPGESAQMRVTLSNGEGWQQAENVVVTLTSSDPNVNIIDGEAVYANIIFPGGVGINFNDTFEIFISNEVNIGNVELILNVVADGADEYEYSDEIPFNINVSINQEGFPLSTNQILSSPALADLDGDNVDDIVITDNEGTVTVLSHTGEEQCTFDTGNQIWGSPAVADLDGDGNLEIVVSSKSRHLYVLDENCNVEMDYDSGQYLMGTPALGDIDGDGELEIIVGGYSSPGKLFAVNPEGTDVTGFPVELGEKIQRGVALADFNGNGKVDIVCGTDGQNLYLIYDDGTIADSFPFEAGNDFRSAPSILDYNGDKIIFGGNRDDSFYAVNSDGSLRFQIVTGNDVITTAGFTELNGSPAVFFGSSDGKLYGVDLEGSALSGFPIETSGDVNSSPVFAVLDDETNQTVVVSGNEGGDALAYTLDGTPVQYFPLSYEFPFKGSPVVKDTDGDGDLEILIGTSNSLVNIDVKTEGSSDSYWSMHRGNLHRTGYYEYIPSGGDMMITVSNMSDWNLLGLPVNVSDNSQMSVYPASIEGTLFSFTDSYEQQSQLSIGTGYWLRFQDTGETNITGSSLTNLTMAMQSDWNLISGLSTQIQLEDIIDPEGIIIPGTMFGFGESYEQTNIMEPGKAYWLRTTGAGEITLSSTNRTERFSSFHPSDNLNTLKIFNTTLYFGDDIGVENPLSYSLPPKAPSPSKDIRFSGNTGFCNSGECVIEATFLEDFLTVEFNILDGEKWEIVGESGSVYECSGSESLIMSGDLETLTLRRSSTSNSPRTFSLSPAYPNPFNPVTTITYELPELSYISLSIYDMTGGLVNTIVSGRYSAGLHKVKWNGTNMFGETVTAGLYLYQFKAYNFVQTRKMLLIK